MGQIVKEDPFSGVINASSEAVHIVVVVAASGPSPAPSRVFPLPHVGKCNAYPRFRAQGLKRTQPIKDLPPRAGLQGPKLQRSRVARGT